MNLPVSFQITEAVYAFVFGIASGLVYDFFRVIRKRLRFRLVTVLADISFWIMFAAAMFLLGMTVYGGEQRIFMYIAVFLGGVLYFLSLSRFTVKICGYIADFFAFLLFCITRPVFYAILFTKKTLEFVKNIFQYYVKWYKIRYNKVNIATVSKENVSEYHGEGGVSAEKNETIRYSYEGHRNNIGGIRGNIPDKALRQDRRRKIRTGTAGAKRSGAGGGKRENAVRNRAQR